MKHLFAGAVALSLLVAGAASAQTDQPRPDQPGAYHQDQGPGYDRGQPNPDNRDHAGDRMGERRDDGYRHDGYRHDDRYRHHDGRRVCHWSRHYHQRVCRWYH